jgi:hypothetical protein
MRIGESAIVRGTGIEALSGGFEESVTMTVTGKVPA